MWFLRLWFLIVKKYCFFSLLLREKHKQQSKLNTVHLAIQKKATSNVKTNKSLSQFFHLQYAHFRVRVIFLDRSIIKTVHIKAIINWLCRAAHLIPALEMLWLWSCAALNQLCSKPYPVFYYLILDTTSAMSGLYLYKFTMLFLWMSLWINRSKSYFKSETHNKKCHLPQCF